MNHFAHKIDAEVVDVDAELRRFEAPVIRGQFQAAVKHVEAVLEQTLETDAQAARALIAKLYLAIGDRRFKTIEPVVNRRQEVPR